MDYKNWRASIAGRRDHLSRADILAGLDAIAQAVRHREGIESDDLQAIKAAIADDIDLMADRAQVEGQ